MTRTSPGQIVAIGATSLLIAGTLWAGPVWEENGDAGGTPGTQQNTTGNGQLSRIKGELVGTGPMPDLEDMYLIRICDPQAFFAATSEENGGLANFDTQLWLFRFDPDDPLNANGVVGNDNAPNEGTPLSRITSVPTDGTPPTVQPARYFLAISGQQRDPRSQPGPAGEIFFFEEPDEISGPDGAGGDQPIGGWETIDPPPAIGLYEIALQGVTFGNSPFADCNENGQADACDIATGFSADDNDNGIPDECEEGIIGDVDGDGDVDFTDLIMLLASWGPCPPGDCPADFDNDGFVTFNDLLALLANFGA